MCIAFLLFGYINTYPALFGQVYSVGEATANFYNSLNGIFGIPACIIGGVLVSKTGKPYLIALIGGVGAIATCALNLALGAGPAAYVLHAGISALFIGGFALTANLCIAPRLARTPSLIGYTMSFVNMLYYVGIFACPLLILGLAGDGSGWGAATVLMAAVAAAAVALMAFLTFSRKKSAA
jgi:hypothetical protein